MNDILRELKVFCLEMIFAWTGIDVRLPVLSEARGDKVVNDLFCEMTKYSGKLDEFLVRIN